MKNAIYSIIALLGVLICSVALFLIIKFMIIVAMRVVLYDSGWMHQLATLCATVACVPLLCAVCTSFIALGGDEDE